MPGHCNERRSESGDKLATTYWASSKDLDTADRQRNTGQLETDLAECKGMWTSWGVVATDLSCLRVMMMMMIFHRSSCRLVNRHNARFRAPLGGILRSISLVFCTTSFAWSSTEARIEGMLCISGHIGVYSSDFGAAGVNIKEEYSDPSDYSSDTCSDFDWTSRSSTTANSANSSSFIQGIDCSLFIFYCDVCFSVRFYSVFPAHYFSSTYIRSYQLSHVFVMA